MSSHIREFFGRGSSSRTMFNMGPIYQYALQCIASNANRSSRVRQHLRVSSIHHEFLSVSLSAISKQYIVSVTHSASSKAPFNDPKEFNPPSRQTQYPYNQSERVDTHFAISSPLPTLPTGCASFISVLFPTPQPLAYSLQKSVFKSRNRVCRSGSSSTCLSLRTSTIPGATLCTLIFGPRLIAIAIVRPLIPAFDAAYASPCLDCCVARQEEMLMMTPPPGDFERCGIQAWETE